MSIAETTTTETYIVDAYVRPKDGSGKKFVVATEYFDSFEKANRAVALQYETLEFRGNLSEIDYYFHIHRSK